MPKLINDDRQKPIYETTTFHDILGSLDRVLGIRVSYIPNKKIFIYADINQWVHPMMLRQAVQMGYFPNITDFSQLKNSKQVYDFGVTNTEEGAKAFEEDSYNVRRTYDSFIIMTRPDQNVFEETDLQEILSRYTKNDVNAQINEVLRIAGVK